MESDPKHYQDHEVNFRREVGLNEKPPHPDCRGLSVYAYGGTLEECVASARERFKLDDSWKLVSAKRAGL